MIAVNLIGVWRCMRAEIRAMSAAAAAGGRGGAIVNVSSVAGLVGAAAFSAYVASKHAVVGLTRTAAIEYAQGRHPRERGVSRRHRHADARPPRRPSGRRCGRALAASAPIGRLGTPEEVAAAVVWLCSDAASFVTGHALAVDGGYVAQ